VLPSPLREQDYCPEFTGQHATPSEPGPRPVGTFVLS